MQGDDALLLIHFELIHCRQCPRNRNTRRNASPQRWLVFTRNSLAGFARKLTVFSNRRHTRIKVICFDGTGIWVLSKRLEQGTFSWPKPMEAEATKLKLTPQALAMLTDGVDLRGAKLRPWYEREA